MKIWLVALLLSITSISASRATGSLLEKSGGVHTLDTQGRSGIPRRAFAFNADSSLNFTIKQCRSRALTISAWVWLSSPCSSFFAANDMFFNGLVFGLERSKEGGAGKRLMTCLGNGTEWEKIGCVVECPSSAWNHLAATVDKDGNVTQYVNGRPVVQTKLKKPLSIIPGSPVRVMFGNENSGNANQELGRLDEFEIYDQALQPEEIMALCRSKKPNSNAIVAEFFPLAAAVGVIVLFVVYFIPNLKKLKQLWFNQKNDLLLHGGQRKRQPSPY